MTSLVTFACLSLIAIANVLQVSGYDLTHEYSGSTFFDDWDFYGSWDNLTFGDVNWVDKTTATTSQLAYINSAGNAIVKVDDTSNVASNYKRNSVRITSKQVYGLGTLWITDFLHLPYGCSVWPSFGTKGQTWPQDGGIDIVQGINVNANNRMAIHTRPGCRHTAPLPNQHGTPSDPDCAQDEGCFVTETTPNSYGAAFAGAGGGVFAAQFDQNGIYLWFWSRPNIPASIQKLTSTSPVASLDDWGLPTASYPNGNDCNIAQYFNPQNLLLEITLCGSWAGAASTYNPQCHDRGPTGSCYDDNVVGTGANYNTAYYEIKYLRAYATNYTVGGPSNRTSSPTGPQPTNDALPNSKRSGYQALCRLAVIMGLLVLAEVGWTA